MWGAMTSTITHVDDLNTKGDDMQKVVLSDWWSVIGKMVNKAHGSQEAYGSSHNNNAKVHMTRKSFSPPPVTQPVQKHRYEKHTQYLGPHKCHSNAAVILCFGVCGSGLPRLVPLRAGSEKNPWHLEILGFFQM